MNVKPIMYVIITDDNNGTNPYWFFTPEERDAKFSDFCKENWGENGGEIPTDPYEAYEKISSGTQYAYIYDLDFAQHPLFMALGYLLKEVIKTGINEHGQITLPLDKNSDLRARILRAIGTPINRREIFHGCDLGRDTEDEPIVWRNHYSCGCGEEWTDNWSCQCDDRCGSCNTSISPHESEWIGPEGESEQALFLEAVS